MAQPMMPAPIITVELVSDGSVATEKTLVRSSLLVIVNRGAEADESSARERRCGVQCALTQFGGYNPTFKCPTLLVARARSRTSERQDMGKKEGKVDGKSAASRGGGWFALVFVDELKWDGWAEARAPVTCEGKAEQSRSKQQHVLETFVDY